MKRPAFFRRRAFVGAVVISFALAGAALPAEPQSPREFWRSYDPRREPLRTETVREWREGDITFREVWFDGDEAGGGRIRIYGIFAAPGGRSGLPGILHVHGGGQTVNNNWLKYWASEGYGAFSFNWGGEWPNRAKFTGYPAGLPQGNHRRTSGIKGAPSMADNSWIIWTRVSRRALTFLESQPEIDPKRLGAFGVSMGGTLMWNLAVDDRIKAGCAIYGAGWNTYKHDEPKFAPSAFARELPEDVVRWRRLATPEAYAAMVRFPMLFLSASNDQHGDFDRVLDSLDALPPGVARRHGITPRFRHHIHRDFMGNLPAWMDHHLRGGPPVPETPAISVALDASGVPVITVRPDTTQPIERVEIYYALEHPYAVSRHWRLAAAGNKLHSAPAPVVNTTRPMMAYANVHYAGHLTLSSPLVGRVPDTLGAARASLRPSPLLFGRGEPNGGWTCLAFPTDPIPDQLAGLEYHPRILEIDGVPGAQPDSRRGMVTFKPTDPQFRATRETKRLEFSAIARSGGEMDIVVLRNDHRPGQKSFLARVRLSPGQQWQRHSLSPRDFAVLLRSGARDELQRLDSFVDVEVLEFLPPGKQPWPSAAPIIGEVKWGVD